MYFYTLAEILILVIATAFLLRRYAAKNISKHILIIVYFTWLLSFGIVILVPLDVLNVITCPQKFQQPIYAIVDTADGGCGYRRGGIQKNWAHAESSLERDVLERFLPNMGSATVLPGVRECW